MFVHLIIAKPMQIYFRKAIPDARLIFGFQAISDLFKSFPLDNLPAHKVAGIRELIEARGARLIYLPPYSPDLNPIEKCWSKIKTYLRKAKARTRAELEKALQAALLLITKEDAQGWFKSCGYTIH